jgi:hypothetical protein
VKLKDVVVGAHYQTHVSGMLVVVRVESKIENRDNRTVFRIRTVETNMRLSKSRTKAPKVEKNAPCWEGGPLSREDFELS